MWKVSRNYFEMEGKAQMWRRISLSFILTRCRCPLSSDSRRCRLPHTQWKLWAPSERFQKLCHCHLLCPHRSPNWEGSCIGPSCHRGIEACNTPTGLCFCDTSNTCKTSLVMSTLWRSCASWSWSLYNNVVVTGYHFFHQRKRANALCNTFLKKSYLWPRVSHSSMHCSPDEVMFGVREHLPESVHCPRELESFLWHQV